MTLAPTPVITEDTITVRALLGRVKELILDEPKRLNMGDWIATFEDEDAACHGPACGTIGCLAGWVTLLMRSPTTPRGRDELTTGVVDAEYVSNYALTGREHVDGFGPDGIYTPNILPEYGETWQEDFLGVRVRLGGRPGTLKHAQAVAQRIDTFLERNPTLAERVIDVKDVRARFNI